MIVLDNASIHWTTAAKSTAKSYNMNINRLPPYFPHLDPVEFVFEMVKGHIKHQSSDEIIDYEKGSGKSHYSRTWKAHSCKGSKYVAKDNKNSQEVNCSNIYQVVEFAPGRP